MAVAIVDLMHCLLQCIGRMNICMPILSGCTHGGAARSQSNREQCKKLLRGVSHCISYTAWKSFDRIDWGIRC
jgi:hypothetical protein